MNKKNRGEMTTVWEQRKFGDITKELSEYAKLSSGLPLLTSARTGLMYQSDYRGNSTTDNENTLFSIVPLNACTYRHMSDDSTFHINVNTLEKGLVSKEYPVFVENESDLRFVVQYINSSDSFTKFCTEQKKGGTRTRLYYKTLCEYKMLIPSLNEQHIIADYFDNLDSLITLHQCKYTFFREVNVSTWEQRKLNEYLDVSTTKNRDIHYGKEDVLSVSGDYGIVNQIEFQGRSFAGTSVANYGVVDTGDVVYTKSPLRTNPYGIIKTNKGKSGIVSTLYAVYKPRERVNPEFVQIYFELNSRMNNYMQPLVNKGAKNDMKVTAENALKGDVCFPNLKEQNSIVDYFSNLDHLITLHHHKPHPALHCIYIHIKEFFNRKEDTYMPELEQMIENKLIEQLVYGDSQWTYREDLKTEEDLWANFRYILEQNNKDRLNGEPLSDSEFEQVKNQLQFSSFYKAGEWLVGENGKVQVHVQRDTEKIHLVVMNHEHIAGGSSVYEVINQYSALKSDDDDKNNVRNRRFDVTLLINGLPMIHIELKNKKHSYMDAFRQIKKYIGEGKFTGIFSAVQMFVISNGVDTRYFSAASDTELNPKFMSCWLDKDNNPVTDYLEFAKNVLRIPEAHEMIARYTVLDKNAKRLILLRPYQIHAIEAIRDASKTGRSGFVWHTTGSGKTLTSYKATRNLLMDIPSIDKTIFLIDRKDLDTQTTMAFQAYANNDVITVDETNNVNELKDRLKSLDRTVIVTTIQKLQRLIDNRLVEGTPEYNRIKNLKIGFIVDECHRAVTPATKRELERFFNNSLWFGFTGTPRFSENPYAQLGDLPRTTEELYGNLLHKYTIQNAIHDKAVLGFQVEHNGPKDVEDETDTSIYESESHMLKVLDIILNKSYNKLGFQNGKGMTYEGLLTTSSIQMAQRYYELLKKVKNGETSLKIDEKIKKVLPDFPKFAITYSVAENSEGGQVNKEKMEESLNDYNNMFDKNYDMSRIQTYNDNLNKRLARKDPMYKSRHEQLDLVIVVDRLLTGFDAPCMSTIFIDRQPMGPHDLIQAFSRTNRIFDTAKTDGQVVTFQAPKLFKQSVDNAIKLYSAGGTNSSIVSDWDAIEEEFRRALAALRGIANTPDAIKQMSPSEKKLFVKTFQHFDRLFSQLKSFTRYDESMLADYNITEEEYDNYAGHYLNVMEELRDENSSGDGDSESTDNGDIDPEYELMAYSNIKIDYEYIINLIQNIVTPDDEEEEITPQERERRMYEVKQYIDELRKDNPKVADIMTELINNIESDSNVYKGQSILNIVENMKNESIEKVITDFCINWYASKDDVMYAATHYRNGEIPNESAIKSNVDYTTYKTQQEKALPKFKYYKILMEELKKTLEEEIKPLIIK